MAIKAQLATGPRQSASPMRSASRSSAAWSARRRAARRSPTNSIKPEIGAPGASVSAVAGTGTGTEAFGGTSGATPMVTGAAALHRRSYPTRTVREIKSLLMNTAETTINNNAANTPGYLAPITRIGGGEVRVDRALKSPAAAWVATGTGRGPSRSASSMPGEAKTVLSRSGHGPELQRIGDHATRSSRSSATRTTASHGAVAFTAPSTHHHPGAQLAELHAQDDDQRQQAAGVDPRLGRQRARGPDARHLEFDGYLNLNNTGDRKRQCRPVAPRLACPAAAVRQRLGAGQRRRRHARSRTGPSPDSRPPTSR